MIREMLKDLIKKVMNEIIFKSEDEHQESEFGDTGNDLGLQHQHS